MLYLQLFGILVLFFIILYVAYLAARFAARFSNGRLNGRNMSVIEAVAVGPQKTIQLVKIGGTYMVVGVSKDNITFLKEIDPSEIQEQTADEHIPFSIYFNKLIKRQNDEQLKNKGEAQNENVDK